MRAKDGLAVANESAHGNQDMASLALEFKPHSRASVLVDKIPAVSSMAKVEKWANCLK